MLYNINGIDVEFPKKAYDCQVDYMKSTIQALCGSTNALLESPTGTGKTLSLLCSTLAWQRHMRRGTSVKLEYNPGSTAVSNKAVKRKPASCTIIYASRTHSQLAQVVGELRKTSYKPRMTVVGSRDQLCVHDKISKLKGGALNHACQAATANRACTFKNNLENNASNLENHEPVIMDIEDVKTNVGFNDRMCPYFYTREVSVNADLVLLPYNYLLDNSIRGMDIYSCSYTYGF